MKIPLSCMCVWVCVGSALFFLSSCFLDISNKTPARFQPFHFTAWLVYKNCERRKGERDKKEKKKKIGGKRKI
ncbi:uncharacterized protein BO66DRAFT_391119 [Aspergillus aculeatinus CBS 121060]|uniref:Uncharacterized protein n=1 Tax=Aspergillus aculeatinus CBS 121060 TaxID=1448322 RepID=A0ACD1HCS1_9EURO|nr:hypothetical protein BO66DRAFT_391119 [Aspergillus aculeatinus CBS 121060]RAH71215.1 hypothetical protein BO66DRAFT_391119 [Aspergillus aculeatinus CBS 121060]